MPELSDFAIYGSLLLAGVAGSLHCVGMCGPLLLSFASVFGSGGSGPGSTRPSLWTDFAWYHAGRLWTYGILGLTAGWAGQRLRGVATQLEWQRPASLLIALSVTGAGLVLLGALPIGRSGGLAAGCGVSKLRGTAWFRVLTENDGPLPRLLLGATMGLLPCGLVWGMLGLVAALPGPLHAGAGMVIFGLGTVPSLSAVLLAARIVPVRSRAHGVRFAAVLLIVAGCWMAARTLLVKPEQACPAHSAPAVEGGVTERRLPVGQGSPSLDPAT